MADRTSIDDVYAALTARFAKAWDEGYAMGVADTEEGGLEGAPENPWRLSLPPVVSTWALQQEQGYAEMARDADIAKKRRRARDIEEMPDLPW